MKVPSNHLDQCDPPQAKARPQKRIVSRHWDWKGSGVNSFFFLDHHRKILWGKSGWCSLLSKKCIWVKSSLHMNPPKESPGQVVHWWGRIQHQSWNDCLALVFNVGLYKLVHKVSFCSDPYETTSHQRSSGKSK